jgi:hypothetical protein
MNRNSRRRPTLLVRDVHPRITSLFVPTRPRYRGKGRTASAPESPQIADSCIRVIGFPALRSEGVDEPASGLSNEPLVGASWCEACCLPWSLRASDPKLGSLSRHFAWQSKPADNRVIARLFLNDLPTREPQGAVTERDFSNNSALTNVYCSVSFLRAWADRRS